MRLSFLTELAAITHMINSALERVRPLWLGRDRVPKVDEIWHIHIEMWGEEAYGIWQRIAEALAEKSFGIGSNLLSGEG